MVRATSSLPTPLSPVTRIVAWCALADESIHTLHRRRFADQEASPAFRCSILVPGVLKFAREILEILCELFRVHRDIEIVRNAHAHRPGRVADASRGAHQVDLHDLRQVHVLQQVQRTFTANLFVEQCDLRHAPGQDFPGAAQILRAFDGVAVRPEYFGDRQKSFVIVIDDQGGGHENLVRVETVVAGQPRRFREPFYWKRNGFAPLKWLSKQAAHVTRLPAVRQG